MAKQKIYREADGTRTGAAGGKLESERLRLLSRAKQLQANYCVDNLNGTTSLFTAHRVRVRGSGLKVVICAAEI